VSICEGIGLGDRKKHKGKKAEMDIANDKLSVRSLLTHVEALWRGVRNWRRKRPQDQWNKKRQGLHLNVQRQTGKPYVRILK